MGFSTESVKSDKAAQKIKSKARNRGKCLAFRAWLSAPFTLFQKRHFEEKPQVVADTNTTGQVASGRS